MRQTSSSRIAFDDGTRNRLSSDDEQCVHVNKPCCKNVSFSPSVQRNVFYTRCLADRVDIMIVKEPRKKEAFALCRTPSSDVFA